MCSTFGIPIIFISLANTAFLVSIAGCPPKISRAVSPFDLAAPSSYWKDTSHQGTCSEVSKVVISLDADQWEIVDFANVDGGLAVLKDKGLSARARAELWSARDRS